jgi:tripartite-type tricarboxylate transporter receptor subunit TctC
MPNWLRVKLRLLLTISASVASSAQGLGAQGQTYPASPVKFITSLSAGSGTDPAMRIVAGELGKIWGQATAVINQPGAGGAIAAHTAATAAPDGYTLFMAIASIFTVLPATQRHLSFNVQDFVPIGFVGEVPMGIAASPEFPGKSLSELIAISKAQPGGLNVAVGPRGGLPHLTAELFRMRSGAELTTLFYPGASQAVADVRTGRVPVLIDGLAGPAAGGLVKLLAIASPARLPTRADVPTVAETVPGFVSSGWFVLVAPPRTPNSIVTKLSEDLRLALSHEEVKQKFDAFSVSMRFLSPKGLATFIAAEQELWSPVIAHIGLTAH